MLINDRIETSVILDTPVVQDQPELLSSKSEEVEEKAEMRLGNTAVTTTKWVTVLLRLTNLWLRPSRQQKTWLVLAVCYAFHPDTLCVFKCHFFSTQEQTFSILFY